MIPVIAGLAVLLLLARGRQAPERVEAEERPLTVRVIGAPSVQLTPKARGFGEVRPAATWEAVAQVHGTIMHKNPRLKRGNLLDAGEVILRIDPGDYEVKVAEIEAELQAIEAQLAELAAKEQNTRALLRIEEQALALGEKELERKKKLAGKGSVSRSDLEQEQNNLLKRRQSVLAQRNALRLVPAQRAALEAQLARQQARLKSARRDLERTVVRMPFRGRISEVEVEQDQFVREGEVLAAADDIRLAEVEVQLPISRFRPLVRSSATAGTPAGPAATPAKRLAIGAIVRLQRGGDTVEWPARFARLSDTVDPRTRTVGVIVEVPDPYAGVGVGGRPPLVKGLYVEVELRGRPLPERLIVPRHALHDQRLYVVGREDRLEIRPVEVEMLQPALAVIAKGIEAGERVLVSDLMPAVEGMRLAPQEDLQELEALLEEAGGSP
ncbi:MAG TPA: efflux RND transporter periplasmic adaptor subunit [Kiloniellaceae bacterium]|nr:efflux RND transporter periplasmic adaptor subunit [Kiloniellaceae bacterium]